MQTEVFITGAGPTGLMLACQLARYQINCIIVDKKSGPTAESRAIVTSPRSVEIYQQMGISDKAVSMGQPIKEGYFYAGGKERGHMILGDMGKGLTDFPFLLGLEQSKTENLLYDKLKSYGRDILWNTEFVTLKQNSEGVEAEVKDLNTGKVFTINSKYAVACDGAKSPVRHLLGRKFEGGTYENKFFVADVQLEWQFGYNRLIVAPGKESSCAFFPLPQTNTYRVIGTLPLEYSDKDNITFADVEKHIKAIAVFPVTFKKVNWFSIYKLHHRCIDRFRDGRVFFAGDAAHIHSPAGGQGMNTGLQDSYNLSWKLAFVLKGIASDKLLNTYHTERYPFAQWLMNFTDRLFGMMTNRNALFSFLRVIVTPLIVNIGLKIKAVRQEAFKRVSQLWMEYSESPLSKNLSSQSIKFKAGERLPYILHNGKSLFTLLTEPKFHLLRIGTEEDIALPEKYKSAIKIIHLPLSDEWKKKGVQKPLDILVRPDNHIGILSDSITGNTITDYLSM